MTATVFAILAIAAVAAAVASAARAWWYARHPLHVRWELYPVPHEAPERARHGGSYFEETEWWRSARSPHRWGALAFMTREILLLHALHQGNRSLWYRSFPFHLGLYLMVAGGMALLVTAAASILAAPLSDPAWLATQRACAGVGWAGVVLAGGGAVGLLVYRMTDPGLRAATTPGDLFNLAFFVAALGLLAAGVLFRPEGSADLLAVITGALTWDTSLRIPPLLGGGIVACAALVAYIPMTHMSHFIGKYFTYHAVRWDDRPLVDHARLAAAVTKQLTYRPTWSAPHVGADGERSWADVASSDPSRAP